MSLATLDLLVRAVVVMMAAWVAVTLLRRQPAALRAGIWTMALCGVLVLPALTTVAPPLRVEVLPARVVTAAVSVEDGGMGTTVEAAAASATSRMGTAVRSFTSAARSGVTGGAPGPAVVAVPESPAEAGAFQWPGLTSLLLLGWVVGALFLVVRLIVNHVRLGRLSRTARAAGHEQDAAWTALIDETRVRLAIRRPVDVCRVDAICVPAIAGLWRPVLLLPAESEEWTAEEMRAVAIHELAHIARWDAVSQCISQLACAVYWCVPLVWHGARKAAVLREHASDDVVLSLGMRASAYAETLLRMASLNETGVAQPASLAMASPLRIRERIVAILDPALRRRQLRPAARATALMASVALIVFIASVQPTAQAKERFSNEPMRQLGSEAMAPGKPVARSATENLRTDGPADLRTEDRGPTFTEVAAGLAQSSVRPCEQKLEQSSTSTQVNGNERTWKVSLSGADCKLDLRADGTIEFNSDFTDVASLSNGGSFRLDVTENGERHELELRPRNGALERVWRVNGREQAYDDNARAWFAGILVTIDRRTAIAVDTRLPVLLRQGGVDAVLRETALMQSEYPRVTYYLRLMKARQLSDAELTRLLQQAVPLARSDHYANELIKGVANSGFSSSRVRDAAFELIDTLQSDHYLADSIKAVVGTDRPEASDMDFLVRVMPRVTSDHYKLDVLTTILKGPLQPRHRTVLAQAATGIRSDHYATEFLKALAPYELEPAGRDALFDVVATIQSDHYVVEVLRALVRGPSTSGTEARGMIGVLSQLESGHYRAEAITSLLTIRGLTAQNLLAMVDATKTLRGDSYKSQALQRIAAHSAANDRVRQAVLEEADALSRTYRERVRRVVGGVLPSSGPIV